ncbi:hypothetical protein JTB14_031359 [Gonioctena quinquepunctata]|nr:hypothetical protein JTB14_031359 [Gonioctena quinquepunctata]
MKNFLIDAGLWCCFEPKTGNAVPSELGERALAKINLSLKHCAASKTKKATKAKEAWDALAKIYEDSGIVRLIGIYSSLFKTDFNKCSSMHDNIHEVLKITAELENIGEPFKANVVGGIVLGGFPTEYKPLILGMQGSKQTTTTEFVKNLLLQENIRGATSSSSQSESAFVSKKFAKKDPHRFNEGPRCFNCYQYNHKAHTGPNSKEVPLKKKMQILPLLVENRKPLHSKKKVTKFHLSVV